MGKPWQAGRTFGLGCVIRVRGGYIFIQSNQGRVQEFLGLITLEDPQITHVRVPASCNLSESLQLDALLDLLAGLA